MLSTVGDCTRIMKNGAVRWCQMVQSAHKVNVENGVMLWCIRCKGMVNKVQRDGALVQRNGALVHMVSVRSGG